LFIAQTWLHRTDFTGRFITVGRAWSTAADGNDRLARRHHRTRRRKPACSGSEQRMLRLTASLADGVPVDLGEA